MSCLIGKRAPDFTTKAVVNQSIVENYSLQGLRGKYLILFFYPLDFTFVCPTELIAFQERLSDFQARDCQVVGCSIDSPFTHMAWLRTPQAKGGIEGVEYPLLSDLHKSIAREYGVLSHEEGVAYRGLFLIDRDGIVRHMVINDLALGRSVDEALRMLDALRFHEANGEVCPANWSAGKVGFTPSQKGLEQFAVASKR